MSGSTCFFFFFRLVMNMAQEKIWFGHLLLMEKEVDTFRGSTNGSNV